MAVRYRDTDGSFTMPWKREKVVLRKSRILELGSKGASDNNTDNKFASTVKQIDIRLDCQSGYCSFGKAFAWLRRGVPVACWCEFASLMDGVLCLRP